VDRIHVVPNTTIDGARSHYLCLSPSRGGELVYKKQALSVLLIPLLHSRICHKGRFGRIGGEHGYQPEMTFVNVLPTQNPTLELFKICFRRGLP